MDELDLYGQVLPNLKVNVSYVSDEKDPIIVLASILRDNDIASVNKGLFGAKYPNAFIGAVEFLLSLKNLNPNNAAQMRKKLSLSKQQLLKAKDYGFIDSKMLDAFLKYIEIQPFSGNDAEKAGIKKGTPEMGKWLAQAEAERFSSLMN